MEKGTDQIMKYPKCLIGTILNPGEYFVLSRDKKHFNEVKEIEKCLSEEFVWEQSDTHSFCTLMWVATKISNTKKDLRRGVIESITEDCLYKIFLSDYGHFIEVSKSHIRPITDKRFIEIEPLAYKVKLYGLLPVENVIDNGQVRKRLCQTWSKKASKYVEKIFTRNPQVLVKSQMLQERNVYGDLMLKFEPDEKHLSLKKLLCKNGYAAFSETYFLKLENLSLATDCSGDEMKMKAVEKWQQKHFGTANVCQKPLYLLSEEESDNDNSLHLPSWDNQSEDSFSFTKQDRTKVLAEKAADVTKPFKSIGRGRILEMTVKTLKERMALKETEPWVDIGVQSTSSTVFCSDKSRMSVPREETKLSPLPLKPHLEKSLPIHSTPLPSKELDDSSDSNFTRQHIDAKLVNCDISDLKGYESFKVGKRTVNRSRAEILNLRKSELNDIKANPTSEAVKVEQVAERIRKSQKFWAPFILFQDSAVEPMDSFRQLPLKFSVIKNLEKGGKFDNLSPLQRWAIPAIRKQHNLVMIGSPKTGKTLSYVLCLMDYVQDKSYFEELPEGNGPCVVIVCFSSAACESVYHLCQTLLGYQAGSSAGNPNVKVMMMHGGGCEKKHWIKLTNGCDILISTPHSLSKILEQPSLTNFERLSVMVLDEFDVISQEPFRPQVRYILEKAKASVKGRPYQKIFCGEAWTPAVESLVWSYMKSHALIIGSYMEEAIYKKIIPRLYLVNKMEKQKLLLDLLADQTDSLNKMIACGKPDEAISAEKLLTDNKVQCLVLHENLWASEIRDILRLWKSSSPRPVLIFTDELLSEVEINDVHTLIHYSFPYKSKTNFFLRYSVFGKFDPSTMQEDKEKTKVLNDIILVDDEDHYQLPHIIDFVTRLGGEVPQRILDKCEKIRRQLEVLKADSVPICRNLLAFGSCRYSKKCPRRHAIVSTCDLPKELPSSGWVRFLVTKFHDASFISARLIEHVSEKGETVPFKKDVTKISKEMIDFFASEENRRPLGEVSLGQICGVKCFDEIFVRAEVVEFLQLDENEKPKTVAVRLMDQGDIRHFKSIQLYELPEHLASIPPLTVDIVIVGVLPVDFDANWSQMANGIVENMLNQTLEADQFWMGEIVLSLKNTLFLQSIMIKRLLSNLNAQVIDTILQKFYITENIALLNKNHLTSIRKLCLEGGITFSGEIEENQESDCQPKPTWTCFDEDVVSVKFLAAESHSRMFVQGKKFEAQILKLKQECQREGEETIKDLKVLEKGRGDVPKLSVGRFCLARYEVTWNRGRIEKIEEAKFFIFFIDLGLMSSVPKEDVLPISTTLLQGYPCQAVECRLAGFQNANNTSERVKEKILEFTNLWKDELRIVIVDRSSKLEITEETKYAVNLINATGKSLNKILAEEKDLIEESEKQFLEDFESEDSKTALESKKNIETVQSESVVKVEDSEKVEVEPDVIAHDEAFKFISELTSNILLSLPDNTQDIKLEKSEFDKTENESKSILETKPTTIQEEVSNENAENNNNKKEVVKDRNLKNNHEFLTPKVLWGQSLSKIVLKVMVEYVDDYKLECTYREILFRCSAHQKNYRFKVKLFSGIDVESMSVTVETFRVVLKGNKFSYVTWPRLSMKDSRYWWLGRDVEGEDKTRNFVRDYIEAVKDDLKRGIIKEPLMGGGPIHCVDLDDSEEDIYNSKETDSD